MFYSSSSSDHISVHKAPLFATNTNTAIYQFWNTPWNVYW